MIFSSNLKIINPLPIKYLKSIGYFRQIVNDENEKYNFLIILLYLKLRIRFIKVQVLKY